MGENIVYVIYVIVTAFLLVVLNRVIPKKERNDGWGYAVLFVSIVVWPVMIFPVGVTVCVGLAYISIAWIFNKMIGKPDNVSRETNAEGGE